MTPAKLMGRLYTRRHQAMNLCVIEADETLRAAWLSDMEHAIDEHGPDKISVDRKRMELAIHWQHGDQHEHRIQCFSSYAVAVAGCFDGVLELSTEVPHA